ncbi:polysaccharide biosynthesis tyrosine autokinase [Candidatus Woesearchaeota archaeon]|nr:polysaccharide biosynthesis tyrosine autokinase [Candidatus Woesearchaeota archaeon]
MPEKEVDFRDYVVLLLKYKYLVAGILVMFLGMGFIFYKLEVPYYTSTSRLVLDTESYVTKYNVKERQDASIISSKARSYEVILQAVVDLNLLNEQIKPEISEIIIEKLKSRIPFIKQEPEEKMSIRELVQYYQRRVNTGTESRGQVISITVTAQDSKIASKLANRIAEILIERNLEEKNAKIKKTLAFIENQINSVTTLLESNRRIREENALSPEYIEIMKLDDQIEDLTRTLELLIREKEHLNTREILTYNTYAYYSDLEGVNATQIQEQEEEIEQAKREIDAQKRYIDLRIEQANEELEMVKELLRNSNKTEYYAVQDMDFAVKTNEDTLTSLFGEKQAIQLADLIASKDIKFLSRAYEPIWPDKTKGLINLLVFLLIGGAVSFSSVVVLNFFDKRFRSSDDIENTLQLDVLGVIPKIKKEEEKDILSPNEHPKSIVVEAYRTLRTNLNFEKKGNNIKTIAVTSAHPDEGKTVTILNLASVMADSGDKVLVLDADLRNPAIHKNTKLSRKPGLTEVLAGKAKLSQAMKKIKNNMYALPVGSLVYNPQKVIGSEQMKKLLEDVSKKFDYVLCDTIPILAMSDAEILSSKTNGTIMVLDQKKAVKQELSDIKERLLKINANILGVVVNKHKKRSKKYKFYYSK